jgi:Protein of unknown function (DUF2917)
MILDMKRVVIELEYRGIVPVEDAPGTRIDCLRGRIWITERGSTDDIVLEPGESYVISRGGVPWCKRCARRSSSFGHQQCTTLGPSSRHGLSGSGVSGLRG